MMIMKQILQYREKKRMKRAMDKAMDRDMRGVKL